MHRSNLFSLKLRRGHLVAPLTILFALAAWTGEHAKGQNAPASSGTNTAAPTLTAQSNLVIVRVVVRDSHGVPVTGLKKEDFRLLDRGKEQEVSQFDEEREDEKLSGASAGTAGSVKGVTDAGASMVAVTLPQPARLIAFYFDDLNSRQANVMQARDAADRFLSASIEPTDKVAIFSSDKMLTDFTSDKTKIHEALSQLNGSAHTVQAVRQCPDLSEFQARDILDNSDPQSNAWQLAGAEIKQCSGSNTDPKAPLDGRQIGTIKEMARRIISEAEVRTRLNLQQFEQVTKYVSQLTGERTIVLVSPGFLTGDEQPQVDRIIDHALRTHVVINALDPKGLTVMMRELDASRTTTMTPNERANSAAYSLDASQQFRSADVLAEFTQGTGGQFIHNNNDLMAGFAVLAGHPDHYTLAFVPRELKFDGKFHELKVTLVSKLKGYTVNARRGYFAAKATQDMTDAPLTASSSGTTSDGASGASTRSENSQAARSTTPAVPPLSVAQAGLGIQGPQMDDRVRDALLGSTDVTDLPVGVDLKSNVAAGGGTAVSLLIHLQTQTLPFRKDGDRSLDTVTFAAAVFDANNKVGAVKQRLAKLNLTADQLADLVANGLEVTFSFPLDSGAHRIRAVVMESEGHKIGALSQSIDLP
jgi:VWFA-related protein